jgi:cyanuric acid amidohydrolase
VLPQSISYYSRELICLQILTIQGNGCVNDFSRTLSTHIWEPLVPESAITIFSGGMTYNTPLIHYSLLIIPFTGTEGVLCPHVTFIVKQQKPTGLQAAAGRTRPLEPHKIGTPEHAKEVASSVRAILDGAGISSSNVHLVLVKCPLLTSEKLESIKATSKIPATTDTYESMAMSRYASAVGIAVALGEVNDLEEAMRSDTTWSSKASCSSGAELEDNHILVIASDPKVEKPHIRAASTYMADAIDAGAILRLLNKVKSDNGKVLQVFAKAEASRDGLINGCRHTMTNDSDIHSTRHARAAVGGLIAGLVGDTQIYISGKC